MTPRGGIRRMLLCLSVLSIVTASKARNSLSVHHDRLLQQQQESVLVPAKPLGDESCPCLTPDQLAASGRPATAQVVQELGVHYVTERLEGYGSNCEAHDMETAACANAISKDCITKIPLPADCDKSWCRR